MALSMVVGGGIAAGLRATVKRQEMLQKQLAACDVTLATLRSFVDDVDFRVLAEKYVAASNGFKEAQKKYWVVLALYAGAEPVEDEVVSTASSVLRQKRHELSEARFSLSYYLAYKGITASEEKDALIEALAEGA